MKTLIFDSGPIISLALSNLLDPARVKEEV